MFFLSSATETTKFPDSAAFSAWDPIENKMDKNL